MKHTNWICIFVLCLLLGCSTEDDSGKWKCNTSLQLARAERSRMIRERHDTALYGTWLCVHNQSVTMKISEDRGWRFSNGKAGDVGFCCLFGETFWMNDEKNVLSLSGRAGTFAGRYVLTENSSKVTLSGFTGAYSVLNGEYKKQ